MNTAIMKTIDGWGLGIRLVTQNYTGLPGLLVFCFFAFSHWRKSRTPKSLWEAVIKKKLGWVKKFIQQGASSNTQNQYGEGVLHMACAKGHVAIVRYLLTRRAVINAKTNAGNTPFFYACLHKKWKVITFLLQQGAAINLKNKEGLFFKDKIVFP